MPTTFPGIAIRRSAPGAHRAASHHQELPRSRLGACKAGRAETATDPAQLDMIESVVALKPRDQWPKHFQRRWYSDAPSWVKPPLRWLWPEQQARTPEQLARDLDVALRMPGFQMSISPRFARASTC